MNKFSEAAIMAGINAQGRFATDGEAVKDIFTAMLDVVLQQETEQRLRWETMTTKEQKARGIHMHVAFIGSVPVGSYMSVLADKGKGLVVSQDGQRRSYVWTVSLPGVNPPEGHEVSEDKAKEKITAAIGAWFKAIRT